MMKKLLALYFFYVLVCFSNLLFEGNTLETNTETKEELDLSFANVHNKDKHNHLKVKWNMATQQDFEKASAKQAIGFKMQRNDAKKIDGMLYLKINKKWHPIVFFEDTHHNGDEHLECDYVYLGKNDALNQYLIASKSPNRTIKYYLVNKNTAEIKITGTQPIISPNNKMFVTLNTIPNLENESNSIHVWQVVKTKKTLSIIECVVVDNQDYIPFELRWESSKSLILQVIPKKVYNTFKSNLTEHDFSFIRMTIISFDQKFHTCSTV